MNYILVVILYRICADISIVSEKILCIPVPLFEKTAASHPLRPYGAPSWRRQGKAPPAGKKSPLKKAISKFGVRAQRTALCA